MTDTKHAGTPQGYRIDGESKRLLLPSGQEIETESTECEMELWEIRATLAEENALLRKALEKIACCPHASDDENNECPRCIAKSALEVKP